MDSLVNRVIATTVGVLVLVVLLVWALIAFKAITTIEDLLMENEQLTAAIEGLTRESQIGYAKVVEQTVSADGQLMSRILFVETDRDDPTQRILEREFSLPGDTIYFDALVVKFGDPLIMDGRERALYLWRRVFSDKISPEAGVPMEKEGYSPERYKGWLSKLPVKHQTLFWSEIWELANDPNRLEPLGVSAIYGNALYLRMQPGLIYIFKIRDNGQIYPEAIHDL